MNYLGHAFLSFGNAGVLAGNLIADHVKGRKVLAGFPEEVRRGIELHRLIDAYTDNHAASRRAKVFFRADYGLYSGAILDSLYDHFLASDARYFPSEKHLFDFSQRVYLQMAPYESFFPPAFAQYFPYMKEQNWLYHYRTLQGMQRSLNGLHRRAKYMPPVDKAYALFIGHYHQLAQCYYEIIDDIVRVVKVELSH